MTRKPKTNLDDAIWIKIKNNRIVSILIIAGTIVVSVITFSETLLRFVTNVSGLFRRNQDLTVMNINSVYGLTETTESDVVSLSKDGLILDLSLQTEDSAAREIIYTLNGSDGELSINPYHDYLYLLQKGGPISPAQPSYDIFDLALPTLDFKVVNNSNETVFFTRAIVLVHESKPDPFPVLEIQGQGYNCIFRLANIGWGEVLNCNVAFNLIPTEYETDLGWGGPYFYFPWQTSSPYKGDYSGPYEHQISLGDFDISGYVDMTKYLIKEGVDMPGADHFNAESVESYGPFTNGVAKMYGEITYEGIDFNGNRKKSKLLFENDIILGSPGSAGAIQFSAAYDVILKPEGKNYTRTASLSHSLNAGESDRFNLTISAPKSSRHRFDLTLVYNDSKTLTFRNVNLNYFIKRDQASHIAPPDDSELAD